MKQTHWAHCKNSAPNSFHISWSWLIKYMISDISVYFCISKIPMVLLEYHSEAVDCSKTVLFPTQQGFPRLHVPFKNVLFLTAGTKHHRDRDIKMKVGKNPAATPKGCWSRSAKPRTLPMAWRFQVDSPRDWCQSIYTVTAWWWSFCPNTYVKRWYSSPKLMWKDDIQESRKNSRYSQSLYFCKKSPNSDL